MFEKKTETTDVTAIVEALQELKDRSGIPAVSDVGREAHPSLFATPDDEESDGNSSTDSQTVDRMQALAERLDLLLKDATSPLERSCERIRVIRADRSTLLDFGGAERGVIAAPLTLPPPTCNWRQARITFERINKKTGRALFYFDHDNVQAAARYSRIVDPSVRTPGNRYTQAFNDDRFIDVWVRQTHPELGRLH